MKTLKMTRLTVPAVLMLALAWPSLADEPWPAFRGPGTLGVSSESLPPGEGPLALELVWKRPLGSGYSGISIAGGKLITGFSEGERDFVGAFNPDTGKEIWRYDLAPIYSGHDGSHDGLIATPTISLGRVFMASPWGQVAALDLETGAALWTKHMIEDLGGTKPLYGFGASPLVVGDLVVMSVCGEGKSVVALDAMSGETRWRSFEQPCGGTQNSPVLMDVDGQPQVIVMSRQKLAGLDPSSGAEQWEFALEERSDSMGSGSQSPLSLGDGRMFIKHEAGKAMIVALNAGSDGVTASVVASGRGLARSYSPPTVWGDALYGYSARLLSAVDPSNAELLWRSREPGDGFLLAVGGQLGVITKTGSLHLGSASREGWSETARIELFDDLAWSPPSFANGSFYVRSLGEMARVRVVRSNTELLATATGPEVPAALGDLVAGVGAASNASEAVDRFLDGRELPLIDGNEVVFLWRGGEDVAIGGDMIGMRREEPMHRLEGTDLWWWSTELDRHARMNYVFFVGDDPNTDPSHDRRATATVLGPDMNWNRGVGVETSWFAMPEWPGLVSQPATSGGGGRLETIKVPFQPPTPEGEETPEPIEVTMQVWLPPGYDQGEERYPAVYLHNQGALEAGAWPETLDRVVGQSVAPLIAVFTEWPQMRGYPISHVVESIDARFRTRAERESRANIGMAWDGISATISTFRSPETFGALGLQSLYLLEQQMEVIGGAVGDATAETVPLRIYFEWGKWDLISPHEEMNMRRSSKWAFDLFVSRGWEPIGGEVWDSTDFSSWSNRTGVMLQALFPLEGAPDTLSIWQTGQ
jgi:outer membrane protein assembly factor BamB